ncbi:MAG: ABC-F family ATP-binding cassette domain-containing protein ['Candidatus Kapabacteria' thiocyanatum]|uniref:Probable ATP-binding protein YbiT n=1 Tax=Candidatus Kapaibacterium thiocyanatum TaxID=1895771 RepID=A0A1M3KVC9_9BACT|nr:ABC-F family ATP-binding cassette domain-containing protein ['Candidatus Kapabacteria' thiocyanatum]OJX56363.1 MAG: hypothetical protein BGO89_13605 ['Candidatus Kapabacteria' thiocyanatum]
MITLSAVAVDLGTRMLFSGVSFLIQRGDRIGLVGRNGAGKSTLLGIITGNRRASSGEVARQNGMTLGLLSQDLTLDTSLSLRATALQAFDEVLALQARMDGMQKEMTERTDYETDSYMDLLQRFTDAHELFERLGGLTMHADIDRILTGLGFDPVEFDKPLDQFSGGWQMRAELAKLLLRKPDCLLLDEPTNHLDIDSVQWLEEFLRSYDGAIVLVSHDRTFLDNVTNRTIEITRTKVYDIPAPYSAYEEIRAERMEQQRAAAANQQRERERVQKFIDRFRYKASLATRVQSRIKHLQRMDQVEVDDEDTSSMRFRFPSAPRSGRVVVETRALRKSYGKKDVLRGVDFVIERGEKVAFLGKNGEGKSTMSKIIAGLEASTGGELIIGHNVTLGYYAQHQAEMLGGHNTVLEVMEQASPADMRPRLRALLGAFLFQGDDVNKKVAVLSGGEKSRLALARLLLQPCNLLILDEPTNHLDMLAKEVLKQSLVDYDGAMIVVSHDRDFLDSLTSKVVEFRNGNIKEYIGDVDDYLLERVNAPSKPVPASRQQEPPREVERKEAPPVATPSPAPRTKPVQKQQITKRITDVERKVAETEGKIAELEQLLADPELYKQAERQRNLVADYDVTKRDLDALMAQWAELHDQLSSAE